MSVYYTDLQTILKFALHLCHAQNRPPKSIGPVGSPTPTPEVFRCTPSHCQEWRIHTSSIGRQAQTVDEAPFHPQGGGWVVWRSV